MAPNPTSPFFQHDVACSFCRENLFYTPSDQIAENVILDRTDGSVDYIELAHKVCAMGQEGGWN